MYKIAEIQDFLKRKNQEVCFLEFNDKVFVSMYGRDFQNHKSS